MLADMCGLSFLASAHCKLDCCRWRRLPDDEEASTELLESVGTTATRARALKSTPLSLLFIFIFFIS